MPTPSWGNAILTAATMLLAVASDARTASHALVKTKAHTIEVAAGGRIVRVGVTLDPSLINFADDHDVRVLGTRGRFVLVVDGYASKKQGLSRCQSGSERYVRLIDLGQRRERFATLAESCLKNIKPGDPIAAWSAGGHGFTVNSLSRPSSSFSLNATGLVRPAS